MRIETELQHLGEETHPLGAVTPPIFQTSLFVQESVEGFRANQHQENERAPGYVYSRVGNPNLTIAEKKIAALEGTEECRVFGSGMSAISSAVLSSVAAGDHVVAVDTIYGPSQMFLKDYLPKFGIETTFVDGRCTDELQSEVTEKTKLIYLESPGSLVFRMQDYQAVTSFAKERGIRTMTDNSYSGGIFQKPASMGVDLVVHSATKYLAGHSDVVAGVCCGSTEHMSAIAKYEGQLLGGYLAPFPAWLLTRGLRTLPLRMKEAQRMGNVMFEFLKSRPEVDQICHVGDPGHEQADLINKQMTGSSSLISFFPKMQDEDKIIQFLDSLKVFQLGVSWGGFESLAVMIHFQTITTAEPRFLIRLYCGLEHEQDLFDDLDQAFRFLR